jgi:hypothetical protein
MISCANPKHNKKQDTRCKIKSKSNSLKEKFKKNHYPPKRMSM